jgi:hypothetical protein
VDHDSSPRWSGQVAVGCILLQGDYETDEFMLLVPRPGTVYFIARDSRPVLECGGYKGMPSPTASWWFAAPGRYRLIIWWAGPGSVEITYDEGRQWEEFDA